MEQWTAPRAPGNSSKQQTRQGSGPKAAASQEPASPPPEARLDPGPGAFDFYADPASCWDPYWFWADLTRWQGFARAQGQAGQAGGPLTVGVMLRADTPEALRALAGKGIVKVHPAHLKGSNRFATGRLDISGLAALAASGVSFELGAALRDQGPELRGDAKGYYGRQTDLELPPARDALAAVKAAGKGGGSSRGTIAVFDFGCPFLRDEFARPGAAGATRIKALWHQEELAAEGPWEDGEKHGTGYGRVLQGGMLEGIRRAVFASDTLDEAQAYRCLNYLLDYDDPRRRVFAFTHGAHVLDVAGGRQDPLVPGAGPDPAGEADLIFVQMPEATAADSSGASLGVFLLDALRYILDTADASKPLVVNVSYGSTAGPHDGSTMIEQAMDELLKGRDRFAIVLAGGNSRRLGLHTARVAGGKRSALFRIEVAAGDHTDTFIEFWYAAELAGRLEFRARAPDAEWSPWVPCDDHVELLAGDMPRQAVAALVHRRKVPNGAPAMAVLALRPTEAPDDDVGELARPGQWEVEVRAPQGDADAEFGIEGWIRRDDSRPFSGRVQSRFLGLQPGDADNTLSNIANGERTVAVSGFRWSDGMPAGYASISPRRPGQWPMVYGLCEWDSVNPGVRAAGVRSGDSFQMNGTSVAAPVVARRLFNCLCSAAPPTQAELIQAIRDEAVLRGSMLRIDDPA